MTKQDFKRDVGILTGWTARRLNRTFTLVADGKSGYATLRFKDPTMWYYEDVKSASARNPVSETEIRGDADLPGGVLDIYNRAQKTKKQVETMGVSNIQVKYSGAATEYTDDGLNVVHMVCLEFPIDKQHRKNQIIAGCMLIGNRVLNCYISGREER